MAYAESGRAKGRVVVTMADLPPTHPVMPPVARGRYLRRWLPCSPRPTLAGDPWPRVSATLAKASSSAAISSSTRAPGARRSPWSVPGWQGGGEKVDEQLVDALSLVVMDPVRGVGQALDAVEVGHVVVVGLG